MKFTSSAVRQSASDVSRSVPMPTPAFAQNRSIGPIVASTWSSSATTSASTDTSHAGAEGAAGSLGLQGPATDWAPSPSRSSTTTALAPPAWKRRASALSDAAGTAGDHRHLSLELHGRRS